MTNYHEPTPGARGTGAEISDLGISDIGPNARADDRQRLRRLRALDLVGVFSIIWGVFGLALLVAGSASSDVTGGGPYIQAIYGLAFMSFGGGFLARRGWAWSLAIVVALLIFLNAGVALAHGSLQLSLIAAPLVVFYMRQPYVRTAFGMPATARP